MARRRTAAEQVAYDMGGGRRGISHVPQNPYSAAQQPALHKAYDDGFADADREIAARAEA